MFEVRSTEISLDTLSSLRLIPSVCERAQRKCNGIYTMTARSRHVTANCPGNCHTNLLLQHSKNVLQFIYFQRFVKTGINIVGGAPDGRDHGLAQSTRPFPEVVLSCVDCVVSYLYSIFSRNSLLHR